jgi:prepilin-type N-terminal cleavage/methylation domain-containing protein
MNRAGFTFVEVLVALLMLALLAVAVGQTLLVVERSATGGDAIREGVFFLPQWYAAQYLEEEQVGDGATWTVEEGDVVAQEAEGEERRRWRVFHVRWNETGWETEMVIIGR